MLDEPHSRFDQLVTGYPRQRWKQEAVKKMEIASGLGWRHPLYKGKQHHFMSGWCHRHVVVSVGAAHNRESLMSVRSLKPVVGFETRPLRVGPSPLRTTSLAPLAR